MFGMTENGSEHMHPGIDRLYYFLARIAMMLVMVLVVMFFGFENRVLGYVEWALQ